MINARQYLISFLATISGNKAVMTGLHQMQMGQKRLGVETAKGTKKGQSFNDMLNKASKRALIVAPVWMLLRSIMMGLLRTIGDMVKANLDLEEGMARIRTVLHGTSSQIEAYMLAIKRQILDVAVTTRASIKELAEAFYFLQTANLSAEEAMAGFLPTVNAMVGTGNNAKDTARAMAGAYNTMGKFLEEGMTITEKFTKIADILTYTYATQDVQLSELIQSYTKLAPYLSGLSDEFGDIVTLLGFLNTKLLRAGRTGRLTGRAILQLTKNAEKLASIFGITFDPKQQINFLDTIKQIHEAMGRTTKITAEQGQALQEVFATRAGVVIRLLISHFDELQETITLARENADGFAEAMAEIRMGTVSAQMGRMKNILAVLVNDFVSGVYGAGDFAEALDDINDSLEALRLPFQRTGQLAGWLAQNISISALAWEQLFKGKGWRQNIEDMKLYLITWKNYLKAREKDIEKAKEESKVREKLREEEKKIQELRLHGKKEKEQKIKHTINLLKTLGVHELDIAKYRLESLEILEGFMTSQEYSLELEKAQNEVVERQLKYRQDILALIETAGFDLMKTMGASESQILELKMRQLEVDREQLGEAQYLLESERLRVQQAVALEKEKEKELRTMTNLAMQYQKADEMERGRIRRMMELRGLSPEELTKQYKENMYDRTIIEEYWNNFSQEGQNAIGELIRKMYDLPEAPTGGLAEIPDNLMNILSPTGAQKYWDEWTSRSRDALKEFGDEWGKLGALAGLGTIDKTIKHRIAIDQNIDLGTTIENIEIKLPSNALDRVAEETAKQIEEKLKTDETLQKRLAELLRPYI